MKKVLVTGATGFLGTRLVEKISNISISRNVVRIPRIGDHIWYISNLKKFRNHYPKWKQKYNTKKILGELIESFS